MHVDLTNKKFQKLTILEFIEVRNYKAIWKCKCDCGNEINTTETNLISGNTRSCGCLKLLACKENLKKGRQKRTLPFGESSKRAIIYYYKTSAKKRGYIWELTDEEALKLFSQNCIVCNIEPIQKHKKHNCHGFFLYNGIDRIDNKKGYTKENTQTMCGTCNAVKSDMNNEDFIKWLNKIRNSTYGQ